MLLQFGTRVSPDDAACIVETAVGGDVWFVLRFGVRHQGPPVCLCMYVYIYIYIYSQTYIGIYIYTHVQFSLP